MVYVTAVHMEVGGSGHEHIASVRWRQADSWATGQSSTAEMVLFLAADGTAKVTDGVNTVDVLVVNANPSHIRTYADGKWSDNLLALPRY